jgi:hypothetical protein
MEREYSSDKIPDRLTERLEAITREILGDRTKYAE